MFTLKRKPMSIPSAEQALPGRPQAMPTASIIRKTTVIRFAIPYRFRNWTRVR